MPRPFCVGSVLATTITRSALMPLVMNVFEPLMHIFVALADRGRPHALQVGAAPGSVMAIAVMISPETMPGNQRCFCSSVPSEER
jgi:hypothetical protein